ncbi:hypothetical protein CVT25_007091 [Psilocybe cyanescens]|uniref:Aminoglycoside phosphotransferase domain-containing protein n=1 Tax=Psilocybe cyanescens TaxID=93625 RepID=A0A409XRD7_PSICY|nr:hypothetical protein CVT25_007091 [Psilocybe cyanescens]
MLRRINSRLTHIFNGDLPLFDPIDCLIYCAMAKEKYHIPSLDALLFPLMHTDLNPRNIVVDGNFNITGILDWDECPAMIAVSDDPSHDELFLEDRLSFIKHFSSALHSSGLPDDIAAQLPPIVENEEQQVFQSAIGSKSFYAYWVGKYLVHYAEWFDAARGALDRFIQSHPKMAGLPEVLSIHAHLLNLLERHLGHSEGNRNPIP